MIQFEQDTLFGAKIISTISFDEQEIIRDILYLHADKKPIDCDPTYSIGNFYKDGIPKPKHRFDKFPQSDDVVEATSDKLPLPAGSVNVLMFDPPFVIHGNSDAEVADGSCIINERFTGFKDWNDLKNMYSLSLIEFYRILVGGGYCHF